MNNKRGASPLLETKGNKMNQPKFIIVLNADIDPDMSDCNYQVALKVDNNSYYYIADYMTKVDALALATSLNVINNLTGN